jgi:carbon-monoxide dehydrogenase large subunit
VFQNKTPTCQYRGVGHPIACAVTEGLVDLAAASWAWTRWSCGGAT